MLFISRTKDFVEKSENNIGEKKNSELLCLCTRSGRVNAAHQCFRLRFIDECLCAGHAFTVAWSEYGQRSNTGTTCARVCACVDFTDKLRKSRMLGGWRMWFRHLMSVNKWALEHWITLFSCQWMTDAQRITTQNYYRIDGLSAYGTRR